MKNKLEYIKKSCLNKWTKSFILLAIIVGLKAYQQKEVNQEHKNIDFARNIDDLHTRQLLDYVVVSGEFNNKAVRKIHEKTGLTIDPFSSVPPETNHIFLRAKNYPTIEEKKQAVERMREESNSPILIHTDFEGGYVHNFDYISDQEKESFGIPKEISQRRDDEYRLNNGNLSAFPSAEFIGKKYEEIFYSGTNKERLHFIRIMEQYGKSIRKIMEYIGVDVVYGPDVDIVDDFNGKGEKQYIAQDNRSFGENFIIAQDIISAFINGFQSNSSNIILVPKHFVGVGKANNPHKQLDKSFMNKDDGSIAIFKNIINGRNPFLDKKYIDICLDVANQTKGNKEYIKIIKKNQSFIKYLMQNNISLSGGDNVNAVMTTHISGDVNLVGSNEPITFSKKILDILKTKIGVEHPLKNGFIISDDLGMDGASEALESLNIKDSEVNKIITALSAGHDVVLYLEEDWYKFGYSIDDVLDDVAKLIDEGIDLNGDGKKDITKEMLQEKAKKTMDLMVKKGALENYSEGKYKIKDGTYFDPSIKKVLKDSWLSNQGLFTGSSIEDYKKEGNSLPQIIQKKIKNIWESVAHNFPNALYKYITMHEDYEEALKDGKKLIIIDKSESTMFVYSIDGKKLLENHKIGLGKGTKSLDYKHDRKVFGDDKTPVGYYIVVDKTMGKDLYKEFSKTKIDEEGYYGGSNGGMIKLIGPRTPFVAIHGSLEKNVGPASSACVRVIDETELSGKTDIKEQKLINYFAETIPVGSYVIITN